MVNALVLYIMGFVLIESEVKPSATMRVEFGVALRLSFSYIGMCDLNSFPY